MFNHVLDVFEEKLKQNRKITATKVMMMKQSALKKVACNKSNCGCVISLFRLKRASNIAATRTYKKKSQKNNEFKFKTF